MDKLLGDLIRSETRLKYIEEQCKYFEKQALEERNEIKEILKKLSPSLKPLETQPNEDCVFTGPLAWPADYLINVTSDPEPEPKPTKFYVCDSCYNEIKDVRWHADDLNFDLCDRCYIICIRNHARYIVNSRYKICITNLKKILMTKN